MKIIQIEVIPPTNRGEDVSPKIIGLSEEGEVYIIDAKKDSEKRKMNYSWRLLL